jgi:hypothetical protein
MRPRCVAPLVLGILAGLSYLTYAGIMLSAKGAVHEIEAFVAFLIGTVWVVGAVLAYGVYRLRLDVWERFPTLRDSRRLRDEHRGDLAAVYMTVKNVDGEGPWSVVVHKPRRYLTWLVDLMRASRPGVSPELDRILRADQVIVATGLSGEAARKRVAALEAHDIPAVREETPAAGNQRS